VRAICVYLAVYLVVAVAIVRIAFSIEHAVPGLGVPFAGLASYLWTGYAVSRAGKLYRTAKRPLLGN